MNFMARKRCGACDTGKKSSLHQSDALLKFYCLNFTTALVRLLWALLYGPSAAPLELETSKTDENGRVVHEHCYIQQLPASRIESTDPQHPK
jgi:hypothetical protein